MRKLFLYVPILLALLFTGCQAPNVQPALKANAHQHARLHLLTDTFIKVILNSKDPDAVKQQAISDINKLVEGTDAYNRELDSYLKALGEFNLDELIELAKKLAKEGKVIFDDLRGDEG